MIILATFIASVVVSFVITKPLISTKNSIILSRAEYKICFFIWAPIFATSLALTLLYPIQIDKHQTAHSKIAPSYLLDIYKGKKLSNANIKKLSELANNGEASAQQLIELSSQISLNHEGKILAEAQRHLRTALRLDPHNIVASYMIGLARLQTDIPSGAIAIWKHCLEHTNKNSALYNIISSHITITATMYGLEASKIKPADPSLAGIGLINP